MIFNDCIENSIIPTEWKIAVVTPLYKGKKSNPNDVNSYRGISVLPPLAKAFERLLHTQLIGHLNSNNILFSGQYGFRSGFSTEAALHEIISKMFRILSNRKIGIFLFIDFFKAFDLLDSTLLLKKLKWYGLASASLELIRNYFSDRSQIVKYNGILSSQCDVKLGSAQGSCLAPLFFLIFINDMSLYLEKFYTLLFADDTSLGLEDNNYEDLMTKFNSNIINLLEWCKYNRLDINWKKTQIMFITKQMETYLDTSSGTNKKRLKTFPKFISINGNQVEVVSSFKLLGLTIDNKLNFLKHISELRLSINRRLYSIKKLFYLSNSVKIQFFKTFILPYFDYCSTLLHYFPTQTIQKLSNSYYFCLAKLLNLDFNKPRVTIDFNHINIELDKFGLMSFQHRLIYRTLSFAFKTLNNDGSNLKHNLKYNTDLNKGYSLRNSNQLTIPYTGKFNDYGKNTFEYIFSKIINDFDSYFSSNSHGQFKISINNNINLIFNKFLLYEKILNLKYIETYRN